MKSALLTLFAIVLTLGFGISDAEARRFGGGNFGMQRQIAPKPAPRQPSAAPQQNPQGVNPAPQKRSWMGPLAGLAAGLGLAALFSHLGIGEEMASLLLIVLLVLAAVMLYRMLTRRGSAAAHRPPAMQYAGATGASAPIAPPNFGAADAPVPGAATARLPAGFDADAFVRQAKVQFIRLQAANDAANLDDIREFTSPQMFAEIRMQLAERGPAPQRTDVVELNAEVLEVVEEAQRYTVSVRFHGLLREEADAAPQPFDEVWHLTKPRSGSTGWVVAGIQQMT